jgi:hypothetical protein
MTAALAAGRRSMDWAGFCMLGCITALGAARSVMSCSDIIRCSGCGIRLTWHL